MRILFICADVPQARRPRGFIEALARAGHDVTLLCAHRPGQARPLAALRDLGVRVVAVAQSAGDRRRSLARALPGGLPLGAAAAFSPQMLAAVRAEAASGRHDVAHIDGLAASALGYGLRGLPAVIDAGSCASLELTRATRAHGLLAFELARTRRHEAGYLASYNQVIAAAADDAWALGVLAGGAAISVVPTPADPELASRRPLLRDQTSLIVRAGRADGPALAALIGEEMPQIWRQRADITLLVDGPIPHVAGRPADRRVIGLGAGEPAAARATIALALAGGAAGAAWALEALGCGTPLLARPAAARAIEALPGRDLLVAEQPGALAAAVLTLLDDPLYRGRLGRSGRAYVEQVHRPAAAAASLTQIYAAAQGAPIAGWRLAMGLHQPLDREVGA
jgi:glycosyltransferase involved in cell wall biosynthesis